MKELNPEKRFERDLKTIEQDIISKQNDNKYCKFSRLLEQVITIGLTQEQYIKYYKTRWTNDLEKQKIILQACENKFKIGLTSGKDMRHLIKNSNDNTKDKENALKKLKGVQ